MRMQYILDKRTKGFGRQAPCAGGDAELGLVYYLYHVHHILPGDYYGRPQGEKDLLWALSSYEANPPPRRRRRKKTKK